VAIRYYPQSKIISNLNTNGGEFSTGEGKSYSGKYYITYDGKFFSGAFPNSSNNQELFKTETEDSFRETVPQTVEDYDAIVPQQSESITRSNRLQGKPTSYQPSPTAADYKKGYFIRYFIKKVNQVGLVTEISPQEYNDFINGTVDYDVSMYQTISILWKITGPLNSQRKSQYNIIPGIIETNKRLTETSAKTFFGIIEFIGGEYDKFARPTP